MQKNLKGSLAKNDYRNSANQDHQVQQEGLILNVVKIIFKIGLKREILPAKDLPKPGDTGDDPEAAPLSRLIAGHQVRHLRARADQSHFTTKDIINLGDFIQG